MTKTLCNCGDGKHNSVGCDGAAFTDGRFGGRCLLCLTDCPRPVGRPTTTGSSKTPLVAFRVAAREHAILSAAATAAGLTLTELSKGLVVGNKRTRARLGKFIDAATTDVGLREWEPYGRSGVGKHD